MNANMILSPSWATLIFIRYYLLIKGQKSTAEASIFTVATVDVALISTQCMSAYLEALSSLIAANDDYEAV